MKKFKREVNEGQVYIMSQFGVGHNTSNFRATHHDYRIMFHKSTMVVNQPDDPSISRYGIVVTPTSSIFDKDTNLNHLVG